MARTSSIDFGLGGAAQPRLIAFWSVAVAVATPSNPIFEILAGRGGPV